MDGVSLGQFFRRPAEPLPSESSSTSTSPSSAEEVRRNGKGTADYAPFLETSAVKDPFGDDDEVAGGSVLSRRIRLQPHIDLSDDTPSLRTFWDALFYPEVYMKVFYALRITLLCALPLVVLGRHPKVDHLFPARVMLPLWGIADCRYTVGEQVAQTLVSVQGALWTMMWGAVNNSWNLHDHNSAWWCATIFGAFALSLLGNVRGRRLFVLQTVMILQMENLPGGTDILYPVRVGRDMMLGTAFALLQVFFPPRFISQECDALLASGWKDMGRILRTAVTAVWTDDPIQSVIALGKLSTDPLQSVFLAAPPKLFAIMYEPWESTLRLELRKERLEIMKLCTPRIHVIAGTARSLAMRRVFSNQDGSPKKGSKSPYAPRHGREAVGGRGKEHSDSVPREAGRPSSRRSLSEASHEPFRSDHGEGDEAEGMGRRRGGGDRPPLDANPDQPEYFTVRRGVNRILGLQDPSRAAHKDIYVEPLEIDDGASEEGSDQDSADASGAMLFASTRREKRFRDRELEKLKQSRLKVRYRMDQRLRRFGKAIVKEPLENFLAQLDAVLDGLGTHLNPKETAEKVPFDALQEASAELEMALNKIHFEVLIKSDDPADPFVYSSTVFFHLSMIVLAERLIEYGQLMKKFDRSRYKSQWARVWEFFFYDWWKGFWAALPKRLTLATARDERILKDAIKMALAYGVGIVFTENTDPVNVYFFGMAILMGVGWPTAGDTMVASVYRITGMVCACSIAYMAVWHTSGLTQEIAVALAGTFVALIFRDVPPYSHAAQYCSMLTCTALNSAGTKLVLLSRIVSNCFTVMCYYAICIFFFPVSVLKITAATEARAVIAITERFSALTDVMTAPLYPDDADQAEVIDAALDRNMALRGEMWSLVSAFGEWLPKANAEPTPHGEPFPFAQQKAVHESLRRLAAVTDIVCTGLKQLRRQGSAEHDQSSVQAMLQAVVPVMVQIDRRGRTVMQDFLDAAARPYQWSPERATRHLSEFLYLSDDLYRAFHIAHRRNTRALRQQFREGVMSRTFAAAARANLFEPNAAAAVATALTGELRRSFCGHGGAAGGGGGGSRGSFVVSSPLMSFAASPRGAGPPRISGAAGRGGGGAQGPPNDSFVEPSLTSRRNSSGAFAAAYLRGGKTITTTTTTAAAPSPPPPPPPPLHYHASISDVEEDEAQFNEVHVPSLVNASVTKSILDQLRMLEEHSAVLSPHALLQETESATLNAGDYYLPLPRPLVATAMAPTLKTSNPLQSGDSAGSSSYATSPARPRPQALAAGKGEEADTNASFARVLTNASMTVRDLENVLKPMEQRAEDEEYRAFVARRRRLLPTMRGGEFALSHSLDAVNSLLVAADIYFSEAEKLTKTMYHINTYAKSHQPLPGSSIWDAQARKS